MTSNLSWPTLGVVVVVLAIIGSVTYLGVAGVVAGSSVVQIYMTVLAALGVGAGVHITSSAMTRAALVREPNPTVINNSVPGAETQK